MTYQEAVQSLISRAWMNIYFAMTDLDEARRQQRSTRLPQENLAASWDALHQYEGWLNNPPPDAEKQP